MTYTLIIPAINEARTRRCMASMAGPHENVIVVNNSPSEMNLPWQPGRLVQPGRNLGVAASWNIGVRSVLEHGHDYLAIVSTSLEFIDGSDVGWIARFGEEPEGVFSDYGWHLIAIGRQTFERVGFFDEQFFSYFEDTDFMYRMVLAGLNDNYFGPWHDCAVYDEGWHLHFESPGNNYGRASMRYAAKWGGSPHEECWFHPYNNLFLDWTVTFPAPPETSGVQRTAKELTIDVQRTDKELL